MVVRWTIGGITFPLNPTSGALPAIKKNITATGTTANWDGQNVLWAGSPDPQTIQFSGTIISPDHYELFKSWAEEYVVKEMTDDLGNSWTVLMIEFDPKRKNRHSHPWAMDYDATVQIVGPWS